MRGQVPKPLFVCHRCGDDPSIGPAVENPRSVPLAAALPTSESPASESAVELYWIPLGAGTRVVELSGRLFEAVSARRDRRQPSDLYHAALTVRLRSGSFSIEQAPVPRGDPATRGVVAQGPVMFAWAGRFRLLRYEVRCWRDGVIPDIDAAVASPVALTTDPDAAARVIAVLPSVPTMVWGRDLVDAGDMWNSNSVVAWTLSRSGLDLDTVSPPANGRAPGWGAGLTVARRQATLAA